MTSTASYPPQLPHMDMAQHLFGYVRHYHADLERQLGLVSNIHEPLTPSGWSAAELANHIFHMERRWILWGFHGQALPDVWGDWHDGRPGTRWFAPTVTLADAVAKLAQNLDMFETTLREHDLSESATTSGKFLESDPPQLSWIMLHVIDELARHLGQLDAALEFQRDPQAANPT
ncbi:mycothiol transferase [Corynebacterium kalinowskii]|nr:DUF664 domain-containing protein [Corynebacterium kalinowskii]